MGDIEVERQIRAAGRTLRSLKQRSLSASEFAGPEDGNGSGQLPGRPSLQAGMLRKAVG